MPGFSEIRRQVVHIAAGACALLLRWLTWKFAALLALAALVFNGLALPRLGPALFRPGDRGAVGRSGIVIYPASVLALILCLPHRLDIVAIAWGILAAGDGCATLVGAHVPSAPLPWNRAKSVGGMIAFVLAGGGAGVALACWMRPVVPSVPIWFSLAAPLVAALVAGLVETTPIGLNDNISVPAMAALTLWSLSLIEADAMRAAALLMHDRLPLAIGVNLVFAWAAWRTHAVTRSGAIVGWLIGTTMWLTTGPRGWTMLAVTFLAAAVTTRMGIRRKILLGIAEARGGRRGPGNAIANTSLAAWAGLISCGLPDPTLARIALVAALTTAASDTVASEIGKAWGRRTWLITSMRRVPPGTSGALSLEGTVAGVASAAALAGIGAALGLVPVTTCVAIAMAAVFAALVESVLGATLEGPGLLNNDALNFVNTGLGAAFALSLWSLR